MTDDPSLQMQRLDLTEDDLQREHQLQVKKRRQAAKEAAKEKAGAANGR